MKVVIVGGSFAGVTAAQAIRSKFPEAVIYLLEKNQEIGFIPGALNLYLKKEVASLDEAYFVSKEQLIKQDILVKVSCEVTSIDTGEQIILVNERGESHQFSYDKLILATGSTQISTQIKGIEAKRILTYKSIKQAKKALALIEKENFFSVIGGGQVGIEMADSLVACGKKVQIIESMDSLLMKYFDPEMIAPLIVAMEEQGVDFFFNETVEEVTETSEKIFLKTQKRELLSDAASFALNVKPQLAYLDDTINCHQDNTIFVDEYLQTSAPNVFAVGDAIQVSSSLSTESFYASLTNNAVRTALVVAENIEAPTTPFVGSARTIGTNVFGYYLASTGMTESESVFFGDAIKVNLVRQEASLFSKEQIITGKLVYNAASRKVLGAQLVAQSNILEKINTLALAIQMGTTIDQLLQKDYFFHPSWTSLYDITNQLGWPKE